MRVLVQENKLPGNDLFERFAAAKRLGLDGIELTIFEPPWLPDRIDEIAKAQALHESLNYIQWNK